MAELSGLTVWAGPQIIRIATDEEGFDLLMLPDHARELAAALLEAARQAEAPGAEVGNG